MLQWHRYLLSTYPHDHSRDTRMYAYIELSLYIIATNYGGQPSVYDKVSHKKTHSATFTNTEPLPSPPSPKHIECDYNDRSPGCFSFDFVPFVHICLFFLLLPLLFVSTFWFFFFHFRFLVLFMSAFAFFFLHFHVLLVVSTCVFRRFRFLHVVSTF